MNYIIFGEEELFVKNKLNEIIKSQVGEVFNFDGNSKTFNINDVINSCLSSNIFNDKNIIVVKDPPFLIKKFEENLLDSLNNYINNPVFETDLIFYTLENKFNSKLKEFKLICKNAQVIECNSYDYKNFNTYVNQQINYNNLDIDNDAAYLLNTICKRNASLLSQNIDILKNYPEHIDSNVINKLCTVSDDNDSFELINSIVNKDISKTIHLERKLINEKDSIFSVIGLLASQLRFLYQIAYYKSINKSDRQVLELINCNEYRYKKAIDTLRNLKLDQILKLLNDLSSLDIKCKLDNSISDVSRFEIYILNLLKKDIYASN